MSAAHTWFQPFRAGSLASKLSGIVMCTTLVGVGLCCVTFAIVEFQVTLRDARAQTTSLARVMSVSTAAAVPFQDAEAALRDKPAIVAASVVLLAGETLARYARGTTPSDAMAGAWLPEPLVARLRLTVAEPVRVGNGTVGSLVLTADLASVRGGIGTTLVLSAIAVGGVLVLVTLPLSRRLQRPLSQPVIALSSAARSVPRDGDDTIRARRHADDEVGALIDRSNAMLDRIQPRDIERMAIERMSFDLVAAIEAALRMFGEEAHAKGLELACAIAAGMPPRVLGAPVRVRQILTNLVGNAITFTQRGEVIVSVTSADNDGASVRVAMEVRDTGVGAPLKVQKRIFDAFSQGDETTTRRFGGAGVGLGIVRQPAELMGGTVSVESAPGIGSSFRFTIPAEIDHDAAVPRVAQVVTNRVLMVDDNATTRRILQHQCTAAALDVVPAEDGPSALAMLRTAAVPSDLVILADRIPRMDGGEVVRAIRADANVRVATVRIVVPSSGGDNPPPAEANRRQIDTWRRKPVGRDALPRCLATPRSPVRETTPVAATVDHPGGNRRPADILPVEDNAVDRLVAREMLAGPGGRVTANAVDGDREQCIAAGRDDHLPKPFKRGQLPALITRHLGGRENAERMASPRHTSAATTAADLPTNTLDASSKRGHHAEL